MKASVCLEISSDQDVRRSFWPSTLLIRQISSVVPDLFCEVQKIYKAHVITYIGLEAHAQTHIHTRAAAIYKRQNVFIIHDTQPQT